MHHQRTDTLFVQFYSIGNLRTLFSRSLIQCQVYSECTAQCHIDCHLQMPLTHTSDMSRDRICREEMREAPLYLDTPQRVCVVTGPEGMEIGHCAIVHTSRSTGTKHGHHIGEAFGKAIHQTVKRPIIVYPEMTLIGRLQIRRSGLGDVTVTVPLHISDIRVRPQGFVDNIPFKSLYFGAGEVQYLLMATQYRFTFGLSYDPIGMFLIKFTLRIHHLGFQPDTEANFTLQCFFGNI